MLGSNQRPLPCEGSVIVCWRIRWFAKYLQTDVFLRRCFSQHFRRFTRVAARLLHTTRRMPRASNARFYNYNDAKYAPLLTTSTQARRFFHVAYHGHVVQVDAKT